jgi:hypothetical protein
MVKERLFLIIISGFASAGLTNNHNDLKRQELLIKLLHHHRSREKEGVV